MGSTWKTKFYLPMLKTPFYSIGLRQAHNTLCSLRLRVLPLHGIGSADSSPDTIELQVSYTPKGPGGSGRREVGAVKNVRFEGGHFVTMLNHVGTAKAFGDWLREERDVWKEAKTRWQEGWELTDIRGEHGVSPEFAKRVRRWDGVLDGTSQL